MKIQIGENIRTLRKEKGITQEKLAELLGVTSQAVSRWESGAGYPDMDQLPGLASLFEVSMDTLLGYDGTVAKQNRLVLKISHMIGRGEIEEGIRQAREALEMYPTNESLAILLATLLFTRKDGDHKEQELEEVVRLCRRVLGEYGGSPEKIITALAAKNQLIPALARLNRREEARNEAFLMPGLTMTREYTLPMVLTGEEKKQFLTESLPFLVVTITMYLDGYAHPEPIPADTGDLTVLATGVKKYTLKECQRDLAVWDTVYAGLPPEADGERELDSLEIYLTLHKRAAALLAKSGRYEEALVHLERARRGELRPAAEKRFHAFNEQTRQSMESITTECLAAFEDAPAEIRQHFDRIAGHQTK